MMEIINPLIVECMLFFQENPYTFETLNGLGSRLGRTAEDLKPVMEQLVGDAIVEVLGTGETAIYRYIQPVSYNINGVIT